MNKTFARLKKGGCEREEVQQRKRGALPSILCVCVECVRLIAATSGARHAASSPFMQAKTRKNSGCWYKKRTPWNNWKYRKEKQERPSSVAAFFFCQGPSFAERSKWSMAECLKKSQNVGIILLQILVRNGEEVCKYYGSFQRLQNECPSAKIGSDTAEHEHCEACPPCVYSSSRSRIEGGEGTPTLEGPFSAVSKLIFQVQFIIIELSF